MADPSGPAFHNLLGQLAAEFKLVAQENVRLRSELGRARCAGEAARRSLLSCSERQSEIPSDGSGPQRSAHSPSTTHGRAKPASVTLRASSDRLSSARFSRLSSWNPSRLSGPWGTPFTTRPPSVRITEPPPPHRVGTSDSIVERNESVASSARTALPVMAAPSSVRASDVRASCGRKPSSDMDNYDVSHASTGKQATFRFGARLKATRMSAQVSVNIAPRVSVVSQAGCLIHPERSLFLQLWDKVTLCAILWVVLVTPVEVSLLKHTPHKIEPLLIFNIIVDLVFLVDMLLQFFIMYPKRTEYGSDWESRPLRIAGKYIKTWFIVDLVSMGIVDWFAPFYMDVAEDWTLKALRVLALLKLTRVCRVLRLYRRFQLHMSITYKELSLIRFFVTMAMLAHWMACLWAFTLILVGEDENVPRWIDSFDLLEEGVDAPSTKGDPWRLYVACFYFCSYTMTSIGYGDIGPQNFVERIVCTFMVVTSGITWAIVLGQVSNIVCNMDSDEAFKATMDDLQVMIQDRGLGSDMRSRLRNFFTANKAAQRRARQHSILESMSPGLRGEVVLHLNREWIARVYFLAPILEEAEETCWSPSRSFLADLSQRLHCEVFSQSEVFGVPHVLYILHCGLVSRGWKLLCRGAVWGTDFVLADLTLVESLQSFALTYAEAFTLHRQELFEVVGAHRQRCPDVKRRIRRTCCWLAFQRSIMKEARRRQREAKQRGQRSKLRALQSNLSEVEELRISVPDPQAESGRGSEVKGVDSAKAVKSVSFVPLAL